MSAWQRGQAASLPEARQMLLRWFGPLTAAIQKEQQRVGGWSEGCMGGVHGWGPCYWQRGAGQGWEAGLDSRRVKLGLLFVRAA